MPKVRNQPQSAWEECSRGDQCSVNACPLHPQYEFLLGVDNSQDKEQKCKMPKTIRKRIGIKWGLKNKGLTSREISGQKRWDELPESVKKERIARLKKISPITRLSEKGYMIAPKKASYLSDTQTNSLETPKTAILEPNIQINEELDTNDNLM